MNEEDLQYQDFISELLYRKGIPINLYTSYKYQLKGESKAGFEIKHDKNFKGTGNVFIESQERHDTSKGYVPSGINRKDNTIFYVIGDYEHVLIFCKKQLKKLIHDLSLKEIEIKKGTSKGYVLRVENRKKEQGWFLEEHKEWLIMEWAKGVWL